MKLIYIHQYFNTNSSSTRSYELSKFLVSKGHEVTMITGSRIRKKTVDGINIKSTQTAYSNNFSFLKRVFAFIHFMISSTILGLKEKDSDIVFATSTPITVGVPGLIISKIKRKKFVFEVRDVWPDIPIELGFIRSKILRKALYFLEKIIYKNADHIIVLSEGMKERLIKKGVPSKKMSVITNLSANKIYDSLPKSGNPIIEKYAEKLVCIHPGTMGFVNGLDFILDIAQSHPDKDIVYLLIGEGNQKRALIERVHKNNINNVIIMDAVPKDEITEIINQSDVGIVTVSNYDILKDNSANKFFDFLAAGKPILLNYEGWQKKVLEENEAGKGFKYSQKDDFFNFLVKLKNDKKLLQTYGENAKKLAVDRYDSQKQAEKLESIVLNTINNN